MSTAKHWTIAAAITAAFLCLGAVLDGPSETEMARAVAADLTDAKAQAKAEFREQAQAALEVQP